MSVKRSLQKALENDMKAYIDNEVRGISDQRKKQSVIENMNRMGSLMVDRVLRKAVQLDKMYGVPSQTAVYRDIYKEVRRVLGEHSDVLAVYVVEGTTPENPSHLYRVIASRPSTVNPNQDECIIWGYNTTTSSLGNGRYMLTCEQAVGLLFSRYFTV